MKEQIPTTLRPEHPAAIQFRDLVEHFGMAGSGKNSALTGISMNTADLRAGDLFVAMPGLKTHGAKFYQQAVELGAVALITDAAGIAAIRATYGEPDVPFALLEQPRSHLGEIAAFVYGNTKSNLQLFGTTGTNGKTSTSYLLEAVLRQLGRITGLTSTAERHIAGEVIVSRLTTPESTEMQALMARMRERGVQSAAIEVSAQALTQQRVDGLFFDVVGFTNLSHDHFDDYPNFETYLRAKAELFSKHRANRGVVCLDSEFGAEFVALSEIETVTITTRNDVASDWQVVVTSQLPSGTEFEVRGPNSELIRSRISLLGIHMASNAGLAIVMAIEAGFAWQDVAKAVASGIDAYLPGRTEKVSGETGPAVFVDFGHSPDAFLNTLRSVRAITSGKVFMVFGADGDRDASKRPAMAAMAAENADVVVITDHHPRFEEPASIRKLLFDSAKAAAPDIEIYEVSPPEQAIRKAVALAKPGDAILWAGPGHQDYRDIQGKRTPYSARAEARAALLENGWK